MTHIVFDERLAPILREQFADVIVFGYNMDIGLIHNHFDSTDRIYEYLDLYYYIPYTTKAVQERFDQQTVYYDFIQKQKTPFCLWVDTSAVSHCGLAHWCYLFKGYQIETEIVDIKRNYPTLNSWLSVDDTQYLSAYSSRYPITKDDMEHYAQIWQQLKQENSSLRVMINGRLTSVDESFYDNFLKRNLPEGAFSVGVYLGSLVLEAQLGVSDIWLYHRLMHYVYEGEYEIVKKGKPPYGDICQRVRTIKKDSLSHES